METLSLKKLSEVFVLFMMKIGSKTEAEESKALHRNSRHNAKNINACLLVVLG